MPDPTLKAIIKRNGSVVPYRIERIRDAVHRAAAATGIHESDLAGRMAQRVEQELAAAYGPDGHPTVEEIQDIVERTLMLAGLTDIARNYIIYRHERAMRRTRRAVQFEVADNIPYKIIYEVLLWNMQHACDSTEALNALVEAGGFAGLVRESEHRFSSEIERVAAAIAARLDALRVIVVAGPSSSGKTTTAIKLEEALRVHGRRLKTINIDHYFHSLHLHPRDETGDYDYETPQALNLALINRHLEALVTGHRVRTPRYDFRTGIQTLDVDDTRLEPGEILLLDSLHGLTPEMTSSLPEAAKFRVYIETLDQLRTAEGVFLRWADLRLLRRMLRDMQHRNSGPVQTLAHWHYVRRAELQYIIPHIRNADAIVNTAMPYELPLLKHRLNDWLPRAATAFHGDARRQDAAIRTARLIELLAPVTAVADDACVPGDSVVREFIGGSRYRYG